MVHESGHALIAVLQEITCYGIYFEKQSGRFCAIAEVPNDSAEYVHKHYLFVAASSAAELILLGSSSDERAGSDRKDFATPGAPSFDETINEAKAILLANKRKLKRLVSKVKARLIDVDYDVDLS